MIKLKQLLNEAKGLLKEITDRNFNFDQLRKNNKKAAKVKAALAKAGVKIDIRKPINQMKYVENHAEFGNKMFKHMQYRYIKGKDGKPVTKTTFKGNAESLGMKQDVKDNVVKIQPSEQEKNNLDDDIFS